MKKHYLFACLLSFAAVATAQQKYEFGFIAKAGNYGIPDKNIRQYTYSDSEINTYSHKPGTSYALGIWQSWPLGKQFRFSTQLLYRSVAKESSNHLEYYFQNTGSISSLVSDQTHKVSESSLAIPVALHYKFKKADKLSIYMGGGIARTFSSNLQSKIASSFDGVPQNPSFFNFKYSDPDDFSFKFNLSAGITFQLDSQTSIGLDYTFEPVDQEYYMNMLRFGNPLIDCICFYTGEEFPANMNSLSVTLRHNILSPE